VEQVAEKEIAARADAEAPLRETSGIFAAPRRRLSLGLVLTIVMVAFEGLAVNTIMPVTAIALGGLALYAWTFSGFMLGSLIGTIAVGDYADRQGPARPFAGALAVFSAGLLACGAATTMPIFIIGRVIEGLGTGAVRSLVWLALNRAYPVKEQARMGAALSSAWILPSLIGPALAGLIARAWSWRVVFLALLPLAPCALWMILRPLREVATEDKPPVSSRGGLPAVQLSAGVGLFLAGIQGGVAVSSLALAAIGAVLAWPALARVLPNGTLGFRKGLPAVLGMRGLLTFAYAGAVAFFPLTLEVVRGMSATLAGLGLSIGSFGWTAGSWSAAALDYRFGPRARPRIMLCGLFLLAAGVAATASALLPGFPLAVAFVGWTLVGLGMGMSFNIDNLLAMQTETEHSAGMISSSMQLTDSLGQALGTGFGGAAMALASWAALGTPSAIGIIYATSVAICTVGMALNSRLMAGVQLKTQS
jgi:MFS family permease